MTTRKKPTPAKKAPAKKPAPKKAAAPTKKGAKAADWDAIERDYRTGKFTFRELELKHGVPNSTITRRAKKEGWTQDLTDAVRQATNAALIQERVQQECSNAQQNAATAVLAAAELNKQVILGHRKHLAEASSLAVGLLEELKAIGGAKDDLMRIAEIAGGDDPERMKDVIRKVSSVHARASSAKTLTDAVDKLMRAERIAFGIDDETGKPPKQPDSPATKYDLTDDDLLAIAGRSRN